MIKVFVYGTLMRGRGNHAFYLGNQRFLGIAELEGYALYDLGSFPGIIAESAETVRGELYEIDAQCLSQLDKLEGNGSLYIRESVTIHQDGAARGAEVYMEWTSPA